MYVGVGAWGMCVGVYVYVGCVCVYLGVYLCMYLCMYVVTTPFGRRGLSNRLLLHKLTPNMHKIAPYGTFFKISLNFSRLP